MLWMFESKEYAVILAASFLAGLLMDMILKKVTKQGETKYTAFLSVCITAVFLGTYGTNEHALVCTLFGQMLLYASEYDLTTHTVPDYVHVLLLLIGLLEIQFVPALLGLVLVPLPFLAAALFKEGSMGGADIKLMAACGFIMGVQKGYMAMIAGLTLAVMIQKVYVRESEDLMDGAKNVIKDVLRDCEDRNIKEWAYLKNNIKESLKEYLYQKTKRNPMILPIIMEV